MQIYSDGKNRVIKGTFPKRFRLLNAGAEVPYLRTAKDAIRLSGELPIGLLDIEEVEQKKTAQPAKLDAASLAIINKGDFDRIDILNKKLAINQEQMNSQLSALTEHEATLANLETQNAQAIEDTKNNIVEMAVAVGKEIQADREALKQTAESFSSSLKDTGEILSLKIEAHEKAKNPHNISKATIGLERVDNTPDIDKPVSKPVKKELDKKADKNQVDELSKKIEETGKKQDKIVKGLDRINWVGGVGGNELPTGGKKGQVLAKASNKTGDYKWADDKVVKKHNDLTGRDSADCHPISSITGLQSALDNKEPTISDLQQIRENATAGKSASETIATYGNIVTHNVSEFATSAQGALADSALQPNSPITGATKCKITYDSNGLVTAGSDLEANDIPSLTISKISDITATASELNVLDGITASTTELNYLDGVTSSIQTQLNGKQPTGNYVTTDTVQTINQAATKTFYGRVNFYGTGDDNAMYLSTDTRIDVKDTTNTVLGFARGTFLINNPAYSLNLRGSGARPAWNGTSYFALTSDIGNATLTIQKNGVAVDTFKANATSDKTINITVPTKTSDLTNDDGFITGINSSDVTTALGYTPYDASNPAGYTSNVGTVTSVNNVQPVNGNVSLIIPTYIHEQGVASAVWTVQHNLNKYPSVTVVDSSENVIIADVEYVDVNTVKITMNGASKGRAYLN